MTGGTILSSLTFSPFQPSWRRIRAPAPRPCVPDGTSAPPGWPSRRATGALAWVGSARDGDYSLFTPRFVALGHGLCSGDGCHLARPGGQTGGNRRNLHCPSRHRTSNAREGTKPQSPSHQPHWGFLPPFSPVCAVRGGERGRAATTPRREDRP
jgi:hypothetical protein